MIKDSNQKEYAFYEKKNNSSSCLAILNTIRKNAPISRIDIAKLTGLSAATVTKFVDNLIESGLIKEEGHSYSRGGRRPVLLRIEASSGFAIGVDIGGENLRVVVADLETKPIFQLSLATCAWEGKDRVLNRVIETISRALRESGVSEEKLKGIGIGISGLIDYERGVSLFCPNLPGWENVPVSKLIEDKFGLPCMVDEVLELWL